MSFIGFGIVWSCVVPQFRVEVAPSGEDLCFLVGASMPNLDPTTVQGLVCSNMEQHAAKPFILLVIGGSTKLNWYELFSGCSVRGAPVQVEMAPWSDIEARVVVTLYYIRQHDDTTLHYTTLHIRPMP
jgi:hypothetical protein